MSLATFPVSLLKSPLDLFQFPGFLTACRCNFAQILDFIEYLLEHIPVLGRQVIDEVSVGEDVLANQISSQFRFKVSAFLVPLLDTLHADTVLILHLGIIKHALSQCIVQFSAFQCVSDFVTHDKLPGLRRVDINGNTFLWIVETVDSLTFHYIASFLQLGSIGEIKRNACICRNLGNEIDKFMRSP